MDAIAREVGQQYAEIRGASGWEALGNAGGFSGSRVWRIASAYGTFCLRAWPAARSTESVLAIHRWMTQARLAGLPFVPRVVVASNHSTVIEAARRCWELTTWQCGRADFHANPSASRLRAAMTALAQLHRAWRVDREAVGASDAALRRLTILSAWERDCLQSLEVNCRRLQDQPLRELGSRALGQLRGLVSSARKAVEPSLHHRLPLQPCLCDIWHDHILFDGDQVTGIVDYGSMHGAECVAADLGRLLGSLVGDESALWEAAFDAYAELRPLSAAERDLARLLDWTGAVVSVGHWLEWLGNDRLSPAYLPAAVRRFEMLVARLESWNENAHGQAPVGIVVD